jgi:hypothetical protein
MYAYLFIYVFNPSTCVIQFGAYPNHKHIKVNVKKTFGEKATAQIGTNVRARVFNVGLLARSQFASRRSCDRPTRPRFSVIFLGPRANAELVAKFHIGLHASYAALPKVTLTILPYTNVTVTFDFGLDHSVHGGYG